MNEMKIRTPAVAGRFYPKVKGEISTMLSNILQKEKKYIDMSLSQKKITGAVVPHAGYMFSAYQAIHFFEIIRHTEQRFDTFFIVNPDHTGFGKDLALDENSCWETPYGKVDIDMDYYDLLGFTRSTDAHKFEHSGEVMLPLLQYFLDYTFKIVPITISRQVPETAKNVAESIIRANNILNKEICIIASSDFSHYVHPDHGIKLDRQVIDEILRLDSSGVYNEIKEKNITVCGYGPIMSLIEYSKIASKKPHAKILKIGHSGEVIPSDEVVDYVSILFYE